MTAYDEKCAGCRYAKARRCMQFRHIRGGYYYQVTVRRNPNECGPDAKLFEPKEKP